MTHDEEPMKLPPAGSWSRVYLIVCAIAVLYIFLLAWFTATFNNPGAS